MYIILFFIGLPSDPSKQTPRTKNVCASAETSLILCRFVYVAYVRYERKENKIIVSKSSVNCGVSNTLTRPFPLTYM